MPLTAMTTVTLLRMDRLLAPVASCHSEQQQWL
jgi:hypothetical protein